jgi:hypothetical protein
MDKGGHKPDWWRNGKGQHSDHPSQFARALAAAGRRAYPRRRMAIGAVIRLCDRLPALGPFHP